MTTDEELQQRMHGLLRSVEPPPAPLDAIIRRGKGIRLRRAGAAAGGLALAGTIAATTVLAPHGSRPAVLPPPAAAPGEEFATGTTDGHAWRLAVQDIADPGYQCLPAVTINGTDADPMYPEASNGATVTLGSADPGVGFAFVQVPIVLQVPVDINGLSVDGGKILRPVTVTVCGNQYSLIGYAYPLTGIGYAYPLTGTLLLTADLASGPPQTLYDGPAASTVLRPTAATPQVDGLWNNTPGSGPGLTASATLASGTVLGQGWSIQLTLGFPGDCYEITASGEPGSTGMSRCGPISTPDGAETIMALPLAFPAAHTRATGYAVSVTPATGHLEAGLSNGTTQSVTPQIVDGRKYAAFIVSSSLRLASLTWLNSAGRVIATTTSLPRNGYVQFQP